MMYGIVRACAAHDRVHKNLLLLGIIEDCATPPQYPHVPAHCIFRYSLFFDPQRERLRGCAFERGSMKIDVAGPRPVLLHDAIDLSERRRLLLGLTKAEYHEQASRNYPDDCYNTPGVFNARLPTHPNSSRPFGRSVPPQFA